MFADDAPSVRPFAFAIYDLSGSRIGPIWERFVRVLPSTAAAQAAPDPDDLLAQAELLLDCVAHIDNYKCYSEPVWSTGFYTTHTIHAWAGGSGAAVPATFRAFPSLPGRGHPVSGSADPRTPPRPASA
jgi:hypothetical protein